METGGESQKWVFWYWNSRRMRRDGAFGHTSRVGSGATLEPAGNVLACFRQTNAEEKNMGNAFQRYTARVALMVVPLAALLCSPFPGWAGTLLGSAQSFAVLGAAGVTSAITDPATVIFGNVGVTPAALSTITGFPPGTVLGGSIFGPGLVANQALVDINVAATTLGLLAVSTGGNLTGFDLGGRTLTPGVYSSSNSVALLDGTLTLDATGDPNARFVFQLAAALTTGSGSIVSVIGGNASTEVYFLVGSQATLGPGSTFAGNILAGTSVVFDSTAKIECGRAFARTASVTMIDNLLSDTCAAAGLGTLPSDFGSLSFSGGTSGGGIQPIPEPGTLTLLSMGLGVGFLWLRKFRPTR